MKDRERLILTAFVNGHSELSSTTLATQLNVTARTVLNDIRAINAALETPLVLYDANHRKYWVKDLNQLVTVLDTAADQHGALDLATDWPFLVYFTLYQADEPITSEHLAEQLHLSKTLLTQTLATLRQTITQWQLKIEGLHDGLVLTGPTIWQKFGLAQLTLPRINRRVSNAYTSQIFANAYSSQALQALIAQLRQALLEAFEVQLNDRDEYLLLLTYLMIRPVLTTTVDLQKLAPGDYRFFQEFAFTRVSSRLLQLPAASPYAQLAAQLTVAAANPQDTNMVQTLVSNLYLHRDAEAYRFFPMPRLSAVPASIKAATTLCFNQADALVLKALDEELQAVKNVTPPLLVLIYTDDYLRGSLLAHRIAKYINHPIQITANMFQLNEMIERYPRICFISPKIRLLSSEMKHEIHYYNIDRFDDTSYFLRFIDEINGLT